jgi:LacI family transcriptional regulator
MPAPQPQVETPIRYHPRVSRGDGKDAKPAVSIHDVAVAARVSIATVSRVMNNPKLVSPKTAARVQEVITQIGYVPNPFAQGLMTKASRVLGIALPDIHGEFYSELLRGADAESRRLGYHLLVSSEPRADEVDHRGLAFGLIDGLAVMITNPDAALVKMAQSSAMPTVVIDLDLHERGMDAVLIDSEPGTREAVKHLLESVEAGKIYFVGGPSDNFDTQQRAKAFAAALADAGHSPRGDQVTFGTYTSEWGREWTNKVLAPTGVRGGGAVGVLAGNDEIAIGIVQAAGDCGLSVPGDVRVVGFDDTRIAQLIRPRLTTVRVPMSEVGAAAVRLLVKRVEDPDAESTCLRLPTGLVVRESSRG